MSTVALNPDSPPSYSVNTRFIQRAVVRPLTGDIPRTSQLAFFLFLLVNATVFLRPAEIVPELLGLPIYEGLIFSCLFLSLNTVRTELMPQVLYRNPITVCVIGVWAGCALSHITHGELGQAVDSTIFFFKTALYFFLLVACVDTPERLKWFVWGTVSCSIIMVGLCVIDYLNIVDFEFVTHITDRDGQDLAGNVELVWRMRGTGIFEDPNDISLIIMASLVMSCYFFGDKSFSYLRFLWILPMAVLITGLLCTRSRGGLLSCGAAFMAYMLLRFGRGWTILAGGCGALLLPFVAGRQSEIDIEDGTAQERIQMWAEGLDALKSPDFFFGIGQDLYDELAGLVAHNSYVHSYVELGFFGGTFFFGCFFFTILALFRVTDPKLHMLDSELRRFAPYMAAIIAGWGVGLFSLSRCYVVPTYMVLGMAATFISIAGPRLRDPCWLVALNKQHLQRWIAASIGYLCFLYLFVKVFARFG